MREVEKPDSPAQPCAVCRYNCWSSIEGARSGRCPCRNRTLSKAFRPARRHTNSRAELFTTAASKTFAGRGPALWDLESPSLIQRRRSRRRRRSSQRRHEPGLPQHLRRAGSATDGRCRPRSSWPDSWRIGRGMTRLRDRAPRSAAATSARHGSAPNTLPKSRRLRPQPENFRTALSPRRPEESQGGNRYMAASCRVRRCNVCGAGPPSTLA